MRARLDALRSKFGAAAARAVFRLPAPWLARLAGRLPRHEHGEVDAKLGFLLRAMNHLDLVEFTGLSAPRARRRARRSMRLLAGPRRPGVVVRELALAGAAGPLRARVYTPPGLAAPAPALVYFHGGGFVIGDLDTHDAACSLLADEGRCVVVAVDYRLAPEHRFPAAVDDAVAAFRALADRAGELGLDPARLAVGGDSAGGNLSAVLAQTATREAWPVRPAFQLLFYPAVDMRRRHASHAAFARGFLLTGEMIDWFLGHYLGDPAHAEDPRASPLLAPDLDRLADLPPAYLAIAGFDPLRDEGHEYAARLRAAGVPVELRCHHDLVHGFLSLVAGIEPAAAALHAAAAALRAALRSA
jgi:acetyl esterase